MASKVAKEEKHWRIIPKRTERKILKIALENPSFSPQRISPIVNVSSHGVWNVLKRNRLNSRERRESYIYKYGASLIKPFSVDDKLTMIRRFESGERVAQICKDFRASRTAFYRWLNRYRSAATEEKRRFLENLRPKEANHWRFVPRTRESVLEIVADHPEFSSQKISQELISKTGKPVLGNHGVYNLLRRLDLNTYRQRLAYQQSLQPIATPTPVPIPAPVVTQTPKIWRFLKAPFATVPKLSTSPRSLLLTFFLTFTTSFVLYRWTLMLSQASSGNQIGLIFATFSLTFGLFFFLYSLKYYFTLILILGFSRQVSGGQDSLGGRTSPERIPLRGSTSVKENGKVRGILKRIFGPSAGSANSLQAGSGLKGNGNGNGHPAGITGGLQPDLSQVTLSREPFVSIHLPMYNEKRVIDRLLTASTSQDYQNYEVVVVDDSTDETTQILRNNWARSSQGKNHPPGVKRRLQGWSIKGGPGEHPSPGRVCGGL